MYLFIILISILVIIILFTIYEFSRNNNIKPLPARPKASGKDDGFDKIMNSNLHEILYKIENNVVLNDEDFQSIEDACRYIDYRFDCLDFRMQTLLRLLYKYSKLIPDKYTYMIKKSMLGSKYFMDQPGEDSICFWSENHLLLFAAAEYLTGQLYPDEIFTNDGLNGAQHKEIAKARINIWLRQRFYYGFTEWYSNTYYEEDIAPLANLIDFCDDAELVEKSKIVMDLLLYDLATQSHKDSFTSTSGRQYEMGKKSGENSAMRNVSAHIWGYPVKNAKNGMDLNFIYMDGYKVPPVIKNIGFDNDNKIIKASCGLDLDELVKEMPKGQSLERVMMQWAMESFSNRQVITETIKFVHKNKMLSNEFLNGFKLINLSILKYTGLLPIINRLLHPFTDGVAIQRANTYTYKTNNYMLATAQCYHPGEFGDQQHIWSATLAPNLCVFTTHPAPPFTEDGALSASPNYWVGNGRNPHSVQDKNINLTIYYINGKKGFMEKTLEMKTHCYFPIKLFDEVEFDKRLAVARIGKSFIAVQSSSDMSVLNDELIQEGELTFWVTELSSTDEETFDSFKSRIKSNELSFDVNTKSVVYISSDKKYELVYKDKFKIEGSEVNINYNRYDSPYSQTARKSPVIKIEHKGEKLTLDFENLIRKTD